MSLVLNVEILGEFKQLTAATKGAESSLGALQKTTANISRKMTAALAAVGLGFSLRTVINELEEAGKAAVEDVKSQGLLAHQMRNTTQATDEQIASVEKQIGKLQLSASVADDTLRPAFATLLRTTKDSAEAMKLLTLATDISAGSGKDLTSVTMALSKAYQGKMAALTKLGVPMSDSIQNASAYAKELGKLQKLQFDVANTTGKDHVKALQKLAEQQKLVNVIAEAGIDWQKDLAEAFNGSAEAASKLDPYQRMQIIFGELQEQVGMALLPMLNQFSTWLATPEGQEKLQSIVSFIVDMVGKFQGLIDLVLANQEVILGWAGAIGAVALAVTGVNTAIRIFTGLQTAFEVVGKIMTATMVKFGVESGVAATRVATLGAAFGWISLVVAGLTAIVALNNQLGLGTTGGAKVTWGTTPTGGATNFSGQTGLTAPNFSSFTNMAPIGTGKVTSVTNNNITINTPKVSGEDVINTVNKYTNNGGLGALLR